MAKQAPVFYVFHGEDDLGQSETLSELKRRLGPPDTVALNTTILDKRHITLAELHHACDAVPFLAEKRLVIVRGMLGRSSGTRKKTRRKGSQTDIDGLCNYLLALPDTTRLVFVENRSLPKNHPVLKLAQETDRGYTKHFEQPNSHSLPDWITKRVTKHGAQIDRTAAKRLAELVPDDLRLLDQEIRKLATYVGAERSISLPDIERMVPYAQAAIVFDMVDAMGRRDGRTAAKALHRLLAGDEHPLGLFAMVVRQFRLLLQTKELVAEGAQQAEIAKALRLHPFPAGKLRRQSSHFTVDQLEAIYRHLLDTDVSIKTGEITPELALDLLVAGIAATDQ